MTDIIGTGGPLGISPIDPKQPGKVGKAHQHGDRSFREILSESLDKVNQLQQEQDEALDRLATGETKNVDEVMVAAKKAEIAFKMMMEIRTKLVDAYQEVKNMRF